MKKRCNDYWNFETCKAEALKYSNRRDFNRGSFAYTKAYRNGWLNEICLHMEYLGNRELRYVYEIAMHPLKIIYVGLTQDLTRRMKDHRATKTSASILVKMGCQIKALTNLIPKNKAAQIEKAMISFYKSLGYAVLNKDNGGGLGGSHFEWTVEICAAEAKKYSTRTEFIHGSTAAFEAAKRLGVYEMICSHMKRKPYPSKWTFETCTKEALKYNSRIGFINGNKPAYVKALKRGWLDRICKHMTKPPDHKLKWTFGECAKEALKYKHRGDFSKWSSVGYSRARKQGWLDMICSHMTRKRITQ